MSEGLIISNLALIYQLLGDICRRSAGIPFRLSVVADCSDILPEFPLGGAVDLTWDRRPLVTLKFKTKADPAGRNSSFGR